MAIVKIIPVLNVSEENTLTSGILLEENGSTIVLIPLFDKNFRAKRYGILEKNRIVPMEMVWCNPYSNVAVYQMNKQNKLSCKFIVPENNIVYEIGTTKTKKGNISIIYHIMANYTVNETTEKIKYSGIGKPEKISEYNSERLMYSIEENENDISQGVVVNGNQIIGLAYSEENGIFNVVPYSLILSSINQYKSGIKYAMVPKGNMCINDDGIQLNGIAVKNIDRNKIFMENGIPYVVLPEGIKINMYNYFGSFSKNTYLINGKNVKASKSELYPYTTYQFNGGFPHLVLHEMRGILFIELTMTNLIILQLDGFMPKHSYIDKLFQGKFATKSNPFLLIIWVNDEMEMDSIAPQFNKPMETFIIKKINGKKIETTDDISGISDLKSMDLAEKSGRIVYFTFE